MKKSRIHKFLTLVAVALLSASCNTDRIEGVISNRDDDTPKITLRISPVSTGTVSNEVTEMIKTLRIIMLNEVTDEAGQTKSYVEFNNFIDFQGDPDNPGHFSGPGEIASTFRYIFTRHTVPGTKKFYLIANEGMVPEINFELEDGETLPNGINAGMSLKTFLDTYTADYIPDLIHPDITPGEGGPSGMEFESLINSIYYTPQFNIEEDSQGDNVIFLPYTAYYSYDILAPETSEADNPHHLSTSIYLVPAATKFRFQFRNYREAPVIIPSLTISGIASDMYLFAHLTDNNELYKNYGGSKVWWTDWLAYLSKDSQALTDATENGVFNTRYGWISNFQIPATAYPEETSGEYDGETRNGVFQIINEMNSIEVPGNTTSDPILGPPGVALSDYFYFPESRNMVQQEIFDENGGSLGPINVQRYWMTITMKGTEIGSPQDIRDAQIGNLGSMFRDTYTLITITMRDAKDVGAYAQIQNWSVTHTYGNVIEDNTPYE